MPKPNLVTVERLWPDSTVVCIASGPSLTQEDVEFVRGKARVIAINNGYELAPWADILWATDKHWFEWYPGHASFQGMTFSLHAHPQGRPQHVRLLKDGGYDGLSRDPSVVCHGGNGGYAAMNLAVHLGAAKIVLLGYDLQRTGGKLHWHPDHPKTTEDLCPKWVRKFGTLVQPLEQAGVTVINATRETALHYWPRVPVESIFAADRSEAA